MRLLVQRVSRAAVRIDTSAPTHSRSAPSAASLPARGGGDVRSIGRGLVLLLGVGPSDDEAAAKKMAAKTANLRIFSNPEGKFDKSLLDVGGEALVVSQFTLFGDCRKGRRPDFTGAAKPEKAIPLYQRFVRELESLGVGVKTGEFGAKMEVEIVNDGPVTLWLDSRA